MPYRRTVIATGEIYHVLNRGVAQTSIFSSKRDYSRFLSLIDYYRYNGLGLCFSFFERLSYEEKALMMRDIKKRCQLQVEIYAYCLMPNHFHLLAKQLSDGGISRMLACLQNSYAKYFNFKSKRQGPLFQSMFKVVRIENEEQFLHVSRYIHLNPSTSFLVEPEKLSSWLWSSFSEYLGLRPTCFLNTDLILKMTGGSKLYEKFVLNQADYQRKIGMIKRLSLENP